MPINQYEKLLSFLKKLDEVKIHYSLGCSREEAVMVHVNVPGERWEIEFMINGEIEIERFVSTGEIEGEDKITYLFEKYSD